MKTGTATRTAALFCLGAVAVATPIAAQQELPLAQVGFTYAPHFFIAVIGGVILAIGFQILLTSLSVASGITLIGNVEKKAEKRTHEREKERAQERDEEPRRDWEREQATVRTQEPPRAEGKDQWETRAYVVERDESQEEEEEESTSPIVKLSNAIGAWTVVTASISLFFASLLAVRLTVVGTVWMGISLGLIIWAAFFAAMTYLEIRSVSTLIGGVFTAALSGLRGSFAAAKGVFGSSTEDKIAKMGTDSINALREELSGAFDVNAISEKFDEYVERLRPQPLDFDRIRAELMDILRNVQFEEHAEVSEGQLDRQTFIRLVEDQPNLKKQDAERLKNMYGDISSELKKEGRGSEKAEAIASKLAPGSREDIAQTRAKMEQYLRQTGREELDPERIKEDIDQMFEDPKSSPEILMNRLNSMDRETLVSLIAQRDDMSQEKAEKLVHKVEQGIQFVREKVLGMSSKAGEMEKEAGGAVQGKISQMKGIPGKVEDRVRQYMSSIGRPEFDYDRIRLDFERMLHDPKASLKILRARMKLYDRDSLIALLSSRKNVSEQDAEQMVQKVEEARDNVLHRAEKVEGEVRSRINQAKKMALHEAENVRKASAAAAWWMVGTAVISGFFAALGATIAIIW